MNRTLKSYCHNLQPGTTITGKWYKNNYIIKQKLGSGAIGSVYLCKSNNKEVALKISEQNSSMTVEVNVLKALNKVQGNRLGPYLLDVDDWEVGQNRNHTFYVMEYLEGESMAKFLSQRGSEWITVFLLQLLDDLEKLHQAGWVFGDLKSDNLLIVTSPPKIRWIDVGGTTQIGRSIKEYTEFFDRGYWGMGSRKAEPSYDLFALVMVFLHLFYPNYFAKGAEPEKTLFSKLDQVQALQSVKAIFKKALLGEYKSSIMMKQAVVSKLSRLQRKNKQDKQKKRPILSFLIEFSGISLLATLFYMLSIFL